METRAGPESGKLATEARAVRPGERRKNLTKTRDYKLISGDSHVNEPPELWRDRVPAKYADRAPRMERFEEGDAWVIEGAADPIHFGLNQCATDPVEKRSRWIKWENVRRGGFDPAERLKEIDLDGVDGELLFPTPRVSNGIWWNREDAEFQTALIRAYNDWLSEYCSHAPDRLFGLAMMPCCGAEEAVLEFHRALALPGIRGVVIGGYPSGGHYVSPADDPLWAEAQAADIPIAIHVSLANEPVGHHSTTIPQATFRFTSVPGRINELIYAEVFDRFPDLKMIFAEVDCGWVPYIIEQMDKHHVRDLQIPYVKTKHLPSYYTERNIFYTYITDTYALQNRREIGLDKILWSSDYAHTSTYWPNTWTALDRAFEGVPADEKQQILAGNAMRLYHID